MKKLKWMFVSLCVVATVTTAVFWDKIQDIRSLMAYASTFEPDEIDQNFRTLSTQYASVTIPNSGRVAELSENLQDDVFPATYTMRGKEKSFDALREALHWQGIVVLRDGQLIYEEYYRGNSRQDHHIEMSVTKSLTSILFGSARDQGHFQDLNALVTDYVPELDGTGYENVTIQQVLDMTSGVRFVEDYDDLNSDVVRMIVAFLRGSVDAFTMSAVNERDPGTFHHYASIDTHVLGWVLRNGTGKSYQQLFEELLWSKIGAESDAKFLVDTTGVPLAFGGANLTLRDLARIGQMMANGGVSLTGERVVSSDWVLQSTTPDTPQSQPGYENEFSSYPLGYKNQWWIPNERWGNDFLAIGIYGQYLYINPQENIVIAVNSAYPDFNAEENLFLDMVPGLQAIAAQVASLP